MPEMLLINPRRRTKAKRKTTARRRRRNPLTATAAKTAVKRRTNPIAKRAVSRRRRNPISLGVTRKDFMAGFKDAAVGAAGAVAIDVLMGQINPKLPASMQISATQVGIGDAVKAGLTVMLGKLLNKSTRGMSQKMATGALTVQAHGLISAYLPDSMKLAGVGYASPAAIINSQSRVGPINRNIRAYTQPGRTQLLNQYASGPSQLLNGVSGVREREGVLYR